MIYLYIFLLKKSVLVFLAVLLINSEPGGKYQIQNARISLLEAAIIIYLYFVLGQINKEWKEND